jgi:UDP-2,3-diacylglucosamine pyrophosphatase LpxH
MYGHDPTDEQAWETRVVPIPKDQIVVIGDSHIGLGDGAETTFARWLDRLEKCRPRALYLNGDLFHYLIAHRKFFTTTVGKVFDRFRALRDAGVPVHYVEGNRDFFLRGSFAEAAVTDVGPEYEIVAGAKKYLIVHGDMLNDRDWPYRFWRRASKNPLSKFAINLIPSGTARRFVQGVEKHLASTNFKHKSNLPVQLMADYARRRDRFLRSPSSPCFFLNDHGRRLEGSAVR